MSSLNNIGGHWMSVGSDHSSIVDRLNTRGPGTSPVDDPCEGLIRTTNIIARKFIITDAEYTMINRKSLSYNDALQQRDCLARCQASAKQAGVKLPSFPNYELGLLSDEEFIIYKKARDAGADRLEISFMTLAELNVYNKATDAQLAKAKKTMEGRMGYGTPQERLMALQ